MSALATMIKTEAKIFAREPLAMFWGLAFPSVLLLAIGFVFPGARQPSPDLGGARLVDLYTPIVLGMCMIMLGVLTLPMILVTYRERGVLRRLSTTPVHPARMVVSQLAVHLAVAVLGTVMALALAVIVFDVALPANVAGFVLVFLLGTAGLFGLGLVIGALAPTTASAQGIGTAVFFPLMFFAGVYFPIQVMPDTVQRIANFTPSGAAVQAFVDTWTGQAPAASSLLVMVAFAAVCGLAAIRLFRWE